MITIRDAAGRTVVETLQDDFDATGARASLPIGSTTTSEGPIQHLSFRVRADEQFYGLGESFTPIGKRGSRGVMWIRDAYGTGSDFVYKAVPYLFSTAGYALVVDTGMPLELDIAETSTAALSLLVPDDVLDCYLILGPTCAEALQRSRTLTGDLVAPPRWAFGTWMSTGFLPQTQASVMACAKALVEADFPTDVIHIDPYWLTPGTWCDLEWDKTAFPDPEQMLAELRELGLRICLWIHPYVSIESPAFTQGCADGIFLKTDSGEVWTGIVWEDDLTRPPVAMLDFTSPAACEWFTSRLRARLREGVAVFKTDFGEAIAPEACASNGLTGEELHNVYPLLYNELAAAVTEEVHGYRLVWGRSSYLGGQRHVAQWGGDTATTWEGMAATLRGGLSYSMSGYSFWSHDVGGFSGSPTPELFRAWAAWGALSPLTRLHGTTSRLPWEWDGRTLESVTESMRFRYQMLPHLYSLALQSVRSGLPLTRPIPMVLDDPGVRTADSCYLLGDDILVAPARDETGAQLAYLPEGTWFAHQTGEKHHGPGWLVSRVDDEIPAFIRAGAILPTTPGLRRVPDGPFTQVILQLWAPTNRTVRIEDSNQITEVTTQVDGDLVMLSVDGPLDVAGVELFAAPQVRRVRFRGTDYATLDHLNFGRTIGFTTP
jgi:alpha-D-xyloside xylohydrolase